MRVQTMSFQEFFNPQPKSIITDLESLLNTTRGRLASLGLLGGAQALLGNPKTAQAFSETILTSSIATPEPTWWEIMKERGRYYDGPSLWEEGTGAIDSVAKFCSKINWVFENPYDAMVIAVNGLANVGMFLALLFCAGSLLLHIAGYKGALKYTPAAIIVYILLKILVAIL